MSVKRNKNGTITIKAEGEVTVISRIGGTFSPKRHPGLDMKYQNWIEACAHTIKACSHTLEETEQFFLQQCEALPMDKDDRRIKQFQYSVVMNDFINKPEYKSPEGIFAKTDEEIEKWHREHSEMQREIMGYSQEHYGLHITGYYLPHTERNLSSYEEAENELKKYKKHPKTNKAHSYEQDICVFFERTTGYMECKGGGRNLFDQIIVYRGVEEEDIRLRNNRFLGYIASMREQGYLPDFRLQ
ncbi:hypothetical protein [Anaerocolumna sp. MB42-C2]|uniref:hypothetical protein n=1 Tax=Anaerocolumna sp. MB42-C2 TaxID=3070997 RepID=UPI0027E0C030|nr:hypothetical protein [Anaerocolumna sp. MB42-C2]WMJ86017.1 hypothetical protein RBU59_18500 [Anaerocolumna sp. MB42-C2]